VSEGVDADRAGPPGIGEVGARGAGWRGQAGSAY
jgi:hypothetical protein